MTHASYEIVLPAIGASSNRGAMGWCNISLVRTEGHTILFDTGSNDDRPEILAELADMGVDIRDIDTIFLSHFHYDHCCNIEVFENAKIYVSERELEYVLSGEYKSIGDPYIPYGMIKYYEQRFETFADGEEIFPGLRALALPGHTPGVSGLILEKERVILTGDSVKNAYDYTHAIPPFAIYDAAIGLESYKRIPPVADTIVPGHGRPFTVRDGRISYVGKQKPVDMVIYPNMEHLGDLEERVGHRIVL